MRCTMPQQAQLVRQRLLLVLMATLLASLAVASTRDVATAAQPADHEPEPEPVPEPEPEPPRPPQPHPAPQPPPKPEPPLFWHGAKALTVPLLLGTLILLGHAPFLIRGCRRLARTIGTDRIGFYVSPVPPRTHSPLPTPPPTLSHIHTHTQTLTYRASLPEQRRLGVPASARHDLAGRSVCCCARCAPHFQVDATAGEWWEFLALIGVTVFGLLVRHCLCIVCSKLHSWLRQCLFLRPSGDQPAAGDGLGRRDLHQVVQERHWCRRPGRWLWHRNGGLEHTCCFTNCSGMLRSSGDDAS